MKAVVLKTVKKLENDLQVMLFEQINTSRAEVEADLGHRITQCEDDVENLLVKNPVLRK